MRDGDVTGPKLARMAVLVVVGLAATMLMLKLLGGLGGQETRAPAMPARGELVVRDTNDGRWLVHTVADFRLRHPGPPFERAPEVAGPLKRVRGVAQARRDRRIVAAFASDVLDVASFAVAPASFSSAAYDGNETMNQASLGPLSVDIARYGVRFAAL